MRKIGGQMNGKAPVPIERPDETVNVCLADEVGIFDCGRSPCGPGIDRHNAQTGMRGQCSKTTEQRIPGVREGLCLQNKRN